jgi:hypothetical protein
MVDRRIVSLSDEYQDLVYVLRRNSWQMAYVCLRLYEKFGKGHGGGNRTKSPFYYYIIVTQSDVVSVLYDLVLICSSDYCMPPLVQASNNNFV